MKITPDTKIYDLIKENEKKAVDVLVSLSPKFKKLLNPVLRKTVTRRVTIKEAAGIGGISLNEFLNKLEANGWDVEYSGKDLFSHELEDKKCKNIKSYKEVFFDAAHIIEKGDDPLADILEKLKTLKEKEVLVIELDFIPYPLINLLKEKGWDYCVENLENSYKTYFFKVSENKGIWGRVKALFSGKNKDKELDETTEENHIHERTKEEWSKRIKSFKNTRQIDVRHLEMPQPMMEILHQLEQLGQDEVLLVDHKRIPRYLLPELDKKGYKLDYLKQGDEHYQLLIYKDK